MKAALGWLPPRMPEVIPMTRSKAYSAVPVNRVNLEQLTQGRSGLDVIIGADLGQFEILAVPR